MQKFWSTEQPMGAFIRHERGRESWKSYSHHENQTADEALSHRTRAKISLARSDKMTIGEEMKIHIPDFVFEERYTIIS